MFATRAVRRVGTGSAAALVAFGIAAALVPGTALAAVGPYLTTGNPSLNERSAPSTSASVVGSLPYHASIYISCQTTGTNVNGSVIWDRLSNGAYVSDYYTTTPVFAGYSPGIPQCSAPSAPPPASTVGLTVSYNEGASGQCTWWAINQFHLFSGLYPNFATGSNNGNAMYWANNAAINRWTVVSTPRVNSIAVFQPGVNGAGSVGHVAWVTAVNGSQITISEMNYIGPGLVDNRTITPASSVRYILAP